MTTVTYRNICFLESDAEFVFEILREYEASEYTELLSRVERLRRISKKLLALEQFTKQIADVSKKPRVRTTSPLVPVNPEGWKAIKLENL